MNQPFMAEAFDWLMLERVKTIGWRRTGRSGGSMGGRLRWRGLGTLASHSSFALNLSLTTQTRRKRDTDVKFTPHVHGSHQIAVAIQFHGVLSCDWSSQG